MELDRWLWKDVSHLGARKLWEYLCTYGYLPRLQDQEVLLEAIAEGLRSRDYFSYAGSVSASGRYEGLVFGQATLASALHLDELSVLVKPDVARAQQKADEEAEVAVLSGGFRLRVTRHRCPLHHADEEERDAPGRDGGGAPSPNGG